MDDAGTQAGAGVVTVFGRFTDLRFYGCCRFTGVQGYGRRQYTGSLLSARIIRRLVLLSSPIASSGRSMQNS